MRTPPSKHDPAAIGQALQELNKFLGIADMQLSRFPFLTGENFTLADIQFGHCLYRYYDIDIDHKENTHVRRYYDSLRVRKAFGEHVVTSYEELRETD